MWAFAQCLGMAVILSSMVWIGWELATTMDDIWGEDLEDDD